MRRRGRCAGLAPLRFAALALLVPVLLGPAPRTRADDPPVLRNGDVLRMHLDGVPVERILREIREAPAVDFDVTEDMRGELRTAGLPETILRAMVARYELDERRREILAAEQPPAPVSDGPTARLTVRLSGDSVRAYDQLDPGHDRAYETGDKRFLDLAVFLACVRPDHVPDHWRSHTPITNDVRPVPRHRLLAFHEGAWWAPSSLGRNLGLGRKPQTTESGSVAVVPPSARDRLGILELELPDTLEAEIDAGETHDLVLGLAVRTENGYTPWVTDELADIAASAHVLELEGVVAARGKRADRAKVQLKPAAAPR